MSYKRIFSLALCGGLAFANGPTHAMEGGNAANGKQEEGGGLADLLGAVGIDPNQLAQAFARGATSNGQANGGATDAIVQTAVDAFFKALEKNFGNGHAAGAFNNFFIMVADQFDQGNAQEALGKFFGALGKQFAQNGAGAEGINNFFKVFADLFEQGGNGHEIFKNFWSAIGDQFRNGGAGEEAIKSVADLFRDGGAANEGMADGIQAFGNLFRRGGVVDQQMGKGAHMFQAQVEEGGEIHAAADKFTALQAEMGTKLYEGLEKGVIKPAWWTVKKNLAQVGLIAAGSCFAWYAAKILPKEIMKYLKTPKLIIESYRHSRWQRSKEFFLYSVLGKKRPQLSDTLIFSSELEARLNNIVKATRNIHTKINQGRTNVKYRNLLLHGPPGTGKTAFAKRMARESGMDYATMSGSSFAKFAKGEGIQALDDLFKWANRSKGLMIFIDEAESFLGKRENMKTNDEMYQLLNNFLNYTGERSNKFMIVFATNHKDSIDSAMHRRIDDAIEIPLPGFEQREKVLKLYRDKILLDIKQNGKSFVDSAQKYVSDAVIKTITQKTEGLSNGDLEGIINSIKTDADITDSGLISNQVVNQVVKHALEKHAAFKRARGELDGIVAGVVPVAGAPQPALA